MGASFIWQEHSQPVSQKQYNEIVEQACYTHGHGGYTGTLAEAGGFIDNTGLHFNSLNGAIDWLQDHAEKWEPAKQVSYTNPDGATVYVIGAWCSS